MLKIFMTMLVTLMFGAPCAAQHYIVSQAKATLNFYVHPGPLGGTKTWTGDIYQPVKFLKLSIPEYNMTRRVYPDYRAELTVSDPSARITWQFGDQILQFTAKNKGSEGGSILYRAGYTYYGNNITKDYIRWSAQPLQANNEAEIYCPALSYVQSDSGVESITIKSLTTLTGMYDATGYNSNMLEAICEWTVVPQPASINLRFVNSDILKLSGESGRPITGSFRTVVTTANATGGYSLSVSSDPDVSFREGDTGAYSPVLNLTRPDKVSYDSVTIGVKIKPAGAGTYVRNVRVTATLL